MSGWSTKDTPPEEETGVLAFIKKYWYIVLPLAGVALLSIVGGIVLLVMNKKSSPAAVCAPAMPVGQPIVPQGMPVGHPVAPQVAGNPSQPMHQTGGPPVQMQTTVPVSAWNPQAWNPQYSTMVFEAAPGGVMPQTVQLNFPPERSGALQTCFSQCIEKLKNS